MRYCLIALLFLGVMLPSFAAERMVWHDEFNDTKLNSRFWTPEVNFVRNIEAVQIYTARPKNLKLTRGALKLTAHHEHFENTNWKPESPHWWESRKEADYTSGSINSRGKVEFRYGRVEIRAKIEHGRGVWPALWLIGNNPGGWPSCGEIDILEYVSQNPQTHHATLHYTKDGQYLNPSTPHATATPLAGDWHLYGMNWTPEKIELTLDGAVVFSHALDDATQTDGKNPFRDGRYFLILNLALDGWAEAPIPEDYPRTFSVDYVRLYQDPTIKGTELRLTPTPKRAPRKKENKKTREKRG